MPEASNPDSSLAPAERGSGALAAAGVEPAVVERHALELLAGVALHVHVHVDGAVVLGDVEDGGVDAAGFFPGQ
jgi:hypothetical protein